MADEGLPPDCQRIAVIGVGGAGKSRFARDLAARTRLPLYHMDTLLWQPNWTLTPQAEALAAHNQLVDGARWIIEGWLDPDYRTRLERADCVIDLDYSRRTVVWRSLKRMLTPTLRHELAQGCHDRFNWENLRTAYSLAERNDITAALTATPPAHLIHLKTPTAARRFLSHLPPP